MFKNRETLTAIELGTSKISVLVAEVDRNDSLSIIGHGEAPSDGTVCKGEVVDMDRVTEILSTAIEEADVASGRDIDPDNILMSVTASDISYSRGIGSVLIMEEDHRVTDEHVNEAVRKAQATRLPYNKEVIGSFDSFFMLDESRRVRNPVDQVANQLEAYVHLIHGDINRVRSFETVLHDVGFESSPALVFSAVASAYGVLTEEDKESGALLVEMGAGTTEYLMVHNYGVMHSGVIPVGCEHLANDLSIGLDLTISECRKLLVEGRVEEHRQQHQPFLNMATSIVGKTRKVPMASIDKIMDLRLRETFGFIRQEIDRSNLRHNFGSGIVLSGGAALIPQVQTVMEDVFQVPVRVGRPFDVAGAVTDLESPRYSTVWGLLKYGNELRRVLSSRDESRGLLRRVGDALEGVSSPFVRGLSDLKDSIKF